jgi:hypothetical protein
MRSSSLVLAGFVGLSLLGALARADKIKEADVPKAVVEALQKKYPGAAVSQWEKEKEDGQDAFEAKLTVKSKAKDGTETERKLEVTLSPDGTLLSEEERIGKDALPDAVKKAIDGSKWAKWSIAKAERIVLGGKDSDPRFEVRFEQEKQRAEVTFDAAGKVIEEEDGEDEGAAPAK